MNSALRILSLSSLLALGACGSIPTRTFEFDAISVDEQPRPCLIVVNDKWAEAFANKQFVNVADDDTLKLPIAFPTSEVTITVAPLKMQNGQPNEPKSRKEARDSSGFMDEVRALQITDPKRVLFILPKKPVNG